jgi:hypothetical protein
MVKKEMESLRSFVDYSGRETGSETKTRGRLKIQAE